MYDEMETMYSCPADEAMDGMPMETMNRNMAMQDMAEKDSDTMRKRSQVPWSMETWHRLDKMVADQVQAASPASGFLPVVGPLHQALTLDSDTALTDKSALRIDEAATVPLIETWVEFALTPQQVEREMTSMAACTLAGRAANILIQAQDLLIFQGRTATTTDPLFTRKLVQHRSGPAGSGLFHAVSPETSREQAVAVKPIGKSPFRFAERTYEAVTEGCARLKGKEHYGPFVLILHTRPYADAHAPLANTLVTPAQRLHRMLQGNFLETGALPDATGLLIDLGGNSMDLVLGREATTSFVQEDPDGKFRFRVWRRFALRLKDPTAIIKLNFLPG